MISVLIAVLNTVDYIGACIESAVRQTYEDLEIIVVDSGSTDGTIDVIRKYVESDNRVKMFSCDKRSYGAQMNLALSQAKGEYVAILEADDMLPENAYEILMQHMKRTDADIVKGDFDMFITASDGNEIYDRNEQFELKPELYDKVLCCKNRSDIIEDDLYLWKGLYKTSFLRENNIKFSETPGAAFQDQGFIIRSLILADSVYYSKDSVYYYRKDNENSSVYNPKCMTFLADEYESIVSFVRSLGKEECGLYLPHIYRRLLLLVRTRYLLRSVFKQSVEFPEESVRRVQALLKEALDVGYLGMCQRYQKDIFELNFFTGDEKHYGEYVRAAIEAERGDVNFFLNRIIKYPTLVLWGCGRNEGMFRMLLDKRGINNKLIRVDIDPKKIRNNADIYDAHEMVANDDEERLYVICSSAAKFAIRKDLHEKYNVPYERIVFYELGSAHYLLWM